MAFPDSRRHGFPDAPVFAVLNPVMVRRYQVDRKK
jgi:hypothetical protein